MTAQHGGAVLRHTGTQGFFTVKFSTREMKNVGNIGPHDEETLEYQQLTQG